MKKTTVVSIEKPEGRFSILYGIHIRSQNPEELPEDVDAVILETGTTKYLDNPVRSFESLKEHVQYKGLIAHLEKKRIPVIFVDLKYRFNDMALLLADNALAGLEWMHGIQLLRKQNHKKRVDVAKVMTAGWLLLPFVANSLRLLSVFMHTGLKQSGALKKLSHKLHPEVDFLYLTFRNAIIAEKEAFLAKHLGKGSHIATILGAGHVGIEDMLEMTPEKRLSNITSVLPILKRIIAPEYLYKAVQYVYNGRNWEVAKVIEVPQLKALL